MRTSPRKDWNPILWLVAVLFMRMPNVAAFFKHRMCLIPFRHRNHVLWTALIVGYSEKGHFEEAVDGFKQMQGEGICEDAAMFVCILKACGGLAATEQAQELHVQVMKKEMEID